MIRQETGPEKMPSPTPSTLSMKSPHYQMALPLLTMIMATEPRRRRGMTPGITPMIMLTGSSRLRKMIQLLENIYDGDGKRLQKTENSIMTTYIYSGINPIYEENSTGLACYVFGPTGLLVKRTTINQESNTYYYHKDHLGSIRSVTDSSKNIIAASTYYPFGETDVEEGSEPYLYNGKEKDTANLYYYGARYYDLQIGRFITRDLIKGNKFNRSPGIE